MFHRMIRLEARRGSGTVWDAEPFFVTDSLRIHVEMEMTMAQQISQASVSIYNLSLDNAKALCGAEHEPASLRNAEEKAEPRRVQIRILAGYRDEAMVDGDLPVLLEGIVMNAFHRRAVPSGITQLFVLPIAAQYLRQTFPPTPATQGMTERDLVKFVLTNVGYKKQEIIFEGSENFLSAPLTPGLSIDPGPDAYRYLNELGNIYNFTYALRAAGVGIYPKMDDTAACHQEWNYLQENGEALRITPMVIRGAVSIGTCRIVIPMVFNARVFPGWVLDVSDLSGNQGDVSEKGPGIAEHSALGTQLFFTDDVARYAVFPKYMAMHVTHVIDNYQDQWETVVTGTVPIAGDGGRFERNFR